MSHVNLRTPSTQTRLFRCGCCQDPLAKRVVAVTKNLTTVSLFTPSLWFFRTLITTAMSSSTANAITSNGKNHHTVVLSESAFTTMLLHAMSHPDTVIHGALLGHYDIHNNNKEEVIVKIDQAVPVCHEHPTKPLMEMALALIQASLPPAAQQQQKSTTTTKNTTTTIVGWYTAPERMDDTRPGTAALRIVASLAAAVNTTSSTTGNTAIAEPVLLVLNNGPLVQQVFTNTTTTTTTNNKNNNHENDMILAFGKDFGQQWLQRIPMEMNPPTKETIAQYWMNRNNKKISRQELMVVDLVDHWEEPLLEWTIPSSNTR